MAESYSSRPYGVVYVVKHRASGRCYVGQTTRSVSKRWQEHQSTGFCVLLYRAIVKYGHDAFDVEVLESAISKDDLDKKEASWIESLGTRDRLRGFNLRDGGSSGKHDATSRRKMSDALRAHYAADPDAGKRRGKTRIGKAVPPEVGEKIRKALTGKRASEQTVRRLSDVRKDLWADRAVAACMRDASTQAKRQPSARAVASCNTKRQWADSESRERLLKAQAAGKAAFWADPVKRAARIAKRAATLERNRLAKAT